MNYNVDDLKSALAIQAIVEALDVPDMVKAQFRVSLIKKEEMWYPGHISTEAFQRGELDVPDA